jgi:NADH-quinone oxidoreductase subunit J
MIELIVFAIAGAACLAGAVGVVASRNPVHAALSLVGTLFGIAVLFVAQEANFLAAVQVIVYAGAIVVLFLFVIMLLGVDREETLADPVPFQRPAAVGLGAVLLVEIFVLAGRTWATGASSTRGSLDAPIDGEELGNVERVARVLFTDFLWAFELTAALLVIAVVGSVVLARRSGQRAQLDEKEDEIAREIAVTEFEYAQEEGVEAAGEEAAGEEAEEPAEVPT